MAMTRAEINAKSDKKTWCTPTILQTTRRYYQIAC